MTRVLVTGAAGQIGRELMRAEWPRGVEVVGFDRSGLDITDQQAVFGAVIANSPDVIVNAAAYTAVDRAEQESEKAFAVNAAAVGHLAAAAVRAGSALIHISTDYVFDGTKDGWYVESDPIQPLGVYGRSKADGEAAAARHDRHLILRTAWVYGALGANFVATMLRVAETNREIKVVDDQVGCPTCAADIASAITKVTARVGSSSELVGTFHLASPQPTSWYGFATAILSDRIADGRLEVVAIPTSEYPTPAARPANSRLDSTAIEQAAGIRLPDWAESLPLVVDELTHRTIGSET